MSEIAVSRIMHYIRAYDEYFKEYPEHPYEGYSVGKWILEYALEDGLITQDEFAALIAIIGGDDGRV